MPRQPPRAARAELIKLQLRGGGRRRQWDGNGDRSGGLEPGGRPPWRCRRRGFRERRSSPQVSLSRLPAARFTGAVCTLRSSSMTVRPFSRIRPSSTSGRCPRRSRHPGWRIARPGAAARQPLSRGQLRSRRNQRLRLSSFQPRCACARGAHAPRGTPPDLGGK